MVDTIYLIFFFQNPSTFKKIFKVTILNALFQLYLEKNV